MLTFFFYLSLQFDLSKFIIGEWTMSLVQEEQTEQNIKQIGIEFHVDEKTKEIVGSFYNNSMEYDIESIGPDAILDFVKVEITDNKFKLISTKNYIGKNIEFEYTYEDGSLDLGTKIDDLGISISFSKSESATIILGEETYQLEREIQPLAAQISPMYYRFFAKKAQQPAQKANMTFFDYLKQAIEPYQQYSYIIYTATFILIVEFIFILTGCCFRRNKSPAKSEEQPEEKATTKEEEGEKHSDDVDDDDDDDSVYSNE